MEWKICYVHRDFRIQKELFYVEIDFLWLGLLLRMNRRLIQSRLDSKIVDALTPWSKISWKSSKFIEFKNFFKLEGQNVLNYPYPSIRPVSAGLDRQIWQLYYSYNRTFECPEDHLFGHFTDIRLKEVQTSKTWFYKLPAAKATQFQGNRNLLVGASCFKSLILFWKNWNFFWNFDSF